jgi:hypothetical protein
MSTVALAPRVFIIKNLITAVSAARRVIKSAKFVSQQQTEQSLSELMRRREAVHAKLGAALRRRRWKRKVVHVTV